MRWFVVRSALVLISFTLLVGARAPPTQWTGEMSVSGWVTVTIPDAGAGSPRPSACA